MDQSWFEGVLKAASAQARHEMERFAAEVRFAEGLCELHADRADAWRPLVDGATALMRRALDGGRTEGIRDAVRQAEKLLAPLETAAKAYTVHCVGHAHIDMNWMWSWPETVAVTNDTFGTVLRLMEEFPEFRFSQSQAAVYAIAQQFNPPLLADIARRVKEGRWEVTASHWVENDKNMACGESLCRHLLYTRRYMRELFGLSPEDVCIDWAPDTFGHPTTVPTYLVRGGIKYLYLHRPGVLGQERPGAFWWQGPDGARVLVRNDMVLGYNGSIAPAIADHLLKFTRTTGCRAFMFVFGVGDHGGGPTRRDVVRALDMDTWPVFPNVKFSTSRAFYEILEKEGDLPTLDCELNTIFTGCYTSQSLIKKANRFGENRLIDAELAATLDWAVAGQAYPADSLRQGWQDTLFSHFHDIMPGSCVRDSRTYSHGLYQKTIATTSMVETQALRHLASLIDTSAAADAETADVPPSSLASGQGAGVGYRAADGLLSRAEPGLGQGNRPFIVFNPTAWDRSDVVEATIWDNAPADAPRPLGERAFCVRTPDGSTVPAQAIDHGRFWGHDYLTVVFPVGVAGYGYSQYAISEESCAAAQPGAWQLERKHTMSRLATERQPRGLENEMVRLEVDPTTGGIRSLLDKRSGIALISPESGAAALEYGVERPHQMTSWLIEHTGPTEHPEASAVRLLLDGPYRASIAVDLRIRESDLTLTYELRAGDPKVYLHLEGTWFQRGTEHSGVPVLRMAFPLAIDNARARYEIPFGAIDRDLRDGEEVPSQQWARVVGEAGGRRAGCLLVNDCKYGHSLDGNVLRLTLIRSSYEPDPLPEIGRHEMHMALAPFTDDMTVAEATRLARELNHHLRVVGTDAHAGGLAPQGWFLSVEGENVVVSGVKKAEDGEGLIVRLYETAGAEATARISLNMDLLGEVTRAQEVDLMERPLAASSVRAVGNSVEVAVPAFGITSTLIEMAGGA